jgi:hypothetical protein
MSEMKKLNPDWIKFVLLRISEIPPTFDAKMQIEKYW